MWTKSLPPHLLLLGRWSFAHVAYPSQHELQVSSFLAQLSVPCTVHTCLFHWLPLLWQKKTTTIDGPVQRDDSNARKANERDEKQMHEPENNSQVGSKPDPLQSEHICCICWIMLGPSWRIEIFMPEPWHPAHWDDAPVFDPLLWKPNKCQLSANPKPHSKTSYKHASSTGHKRAIAVIVTQLLLSPNK